MSLSFWLNSAHFSLELFGALAFFLVAWLAFDSFKVRKDFYTFSRGLGFIFLFGFQILHALSFDSDFYSYLSHGLLYVGLAFVITNLLKEAILAKPKFNGIIIIPSFSSFGWVLKLGAFLGFGAITAISFYQYKNESKKSLAPFVFGFLFLTLGVISSIFYIDNRLSFLGIAGHIFQLIGYLALMWWVWSYLQLRIREEILIILTSITLFMGILICLTFSTILVGQVESLIKASLESNAKVLNLGMDLLKEEARAKAVLISSRKDVIEAVSNNDFAALESLGTDLLISERIGFITFLNERGDVILRAHALTKKEDNLSEERAVRNALSGQVSVVIESSPTEQLSIRGASPIYDQGVLRGVVITGTQLDNAFADMIKKETSSDISISDASMLRVSTTILNPDGRTRSAGVKETDNDVINNVYGKKIPITIRTNIGSRSYLASYVPMVDEAGNLVGIISSAKAQQEIAEIILRTNRFTLLTVIVVMFILIIPIYILSRRLNKEMSI